jgi:FkbM family methyltransferase
MNWRYVVGSSIDSLIQMALRKLPPNRYFPAGRYWTYDLKRLYALHRRTPLVIIDAGANIGQTCLYLAKWFPKAKIYSFEPVRETFEQLCKNTRQYPNIRCIHAALGETEAQQTLALVESSELNTLNSEPLLKNISTGVTETVEVTTLQRFMESEGIKSVDILKMDVQGYELQVLRGAGNLVNVSSVFAEAGFQEDQRVDLTAFAPLHEHLRRRGFFFSGLYEAFRHWDAKLLVSFGNILYVQTAHFSTSEK